MSERGDGWARWEREEAAPPPHGYSGGHGFPGGHGQPVREAPSHAGPTHAGPTLDTPPGGDPDRDGHLDDADSPAGPTTGAGSAAAGETAAGETASVMRSSGIMAAGTMVSRVLGLLRATVLFWAIGGFLSNDAFTTANTLPNTFFILIGGGVLNAVLVPQIVRAGKQADGGQEYVDRLLTVAMVIMLVATGVLTALAEPLFLLYWGNKSVHGALGVGTAFALWCLPQMFFYGLYTLIGQVLNARGNFGPYMWAPVVNNVVAIAGVGLFIALYGTGEKAITWWGPASITVLAGTTTLGVVAQALVLLPVLGRTGFRWRPRWGVRGVGLRTAGKVAGWSFAAVAVSQLGFIITSQVVNDAAKTAADHHLKGAGRGIYDNAYLLFMLPHSLVAVSLVTALFTNMAHSAAAGRLDQVRADLSLGVRTTGTVTVLATVGFAVLGRDASRLVMFGNGAVDTRPLFLVALAMLIGLVPFSAQYLMQRVFYAFEDARTPFFIQVAVIVLWTIGTLISGAVLPPARVAIGVSVAMSVANLLGAAISLRLLRRRIGSVDGAVVLRSHVQFAAAAIGAAAPALLVSMPVHGLLGDDRLGAIVALALGGVVMVAMYAGLLRAMHADELDNLIFPIMARLGRRRRPLAQAGRHALH
jgi:putative peptidoglycan lipid II flippase